jgi:hypothetical protein
MRNLPLILLLAACGGPKPTGARCTGAADSCAGQLCKPLTANVQNAPGICTENCSNGARCMQGGECVAFPDGNSYCLRYCKLDRDCLDGFICIPQGAFNACYAQLKAVVDCSQPPCTGTTRFADYCSGVTTAIQACTCASGSPDASCTASTVGAGVYCCP